MGIDAFVLRYEFKGEDFAAQFLASPDFDIGTLRAIGHAFGISASNKPRNELIDLIASRTDDYAIPTATQKIIERLASRKREWASIKVGRVSRFPSLAKASELVTFQGGEQWYGPVTHLSDSSNAYWYIRPVLIPHWERRDSDGQIQQFLVRWLCFARVTGEAISLHWKGFSFAENQEDVFSNNGGDKTAQFPYWDHIPDLFVEIEEITHAKVEYAKLHTLVLHGLWDEYQDNPAFKWTHRRIRAESSGVSLNAHAGIVYEIEAGGILHLASTMRKAVESELAIKYKYSLPDPARFDQIVLRTLIREYGALSYEFSLNRDNQLIIRAHSYFGLKPMANTPDRFPHLRFFIGKLHDLEQLNFILDHLRKDPAHEEDSKPEELRLL